MDSSTGEKATLLTYLDHQRVSLQIKCEGLTAAQMGMRAIPPSRLSLEGIVRHLAQREHHWFAKVLDERPGLADLWPTDADRGFAEVTGTEQGVTLAWQQWYAAVTFAQGWATACPGELFSEKVIADNGEVSVREVITHLLEEYARHLGHADLLRERIDGRTGP